VGWLCRVWYLGSLRRGPVLLLSFHRVRINLLELTQIGWIQRLRMVHCLESLLCLLREIFEPVLVHTRNWLLLSPFDVYFRRNLGRLLAIGVQILSHLHLVWQLLFRIPHHWLCFNGLNSLDSFGQLHTHLLWSCLHLVVLVSGLDTIPSTLLAVWTILALLVTLLGTLLSNFPPLRYCLLLLSFKQRGQSLETTRLLTLLRFHKPWI